MEERTEIPRAHAEALLDVCAGRLTLERSTLPIDGGAEVLIERIAQPRGINTVTVEFHNPDEAQAFTPPPWFGPEITTESSFGRQVIALDRLPELPEVPLSNAIMEAVLDLLEDRASTSRPVTAPAPRASVETSVLDALTRLSAGASGRGGGARVRRRPTVTRCTRWTSAKHRSTPPFPANDPLRSSMSGALKPQPQLDEIAAQDALARRRLRRDTPA